MGLAASIQVALFLVPPTSHPDYLDASIDKQALLEGPGTDRVLFAGGSNVAFGVDSFGVEKLAGRYTINLGLHANLGLRYMLQEVLSGARKGDLVVLVPEYEHFFGDVANGDVTGLQLLQDNPSALRFFESFGQALNLARNIGSYNLEKMRNLLALGRLVSTIRHRGATKQVENSFATGVYARSSFNERGDMVRHLDQPPPSTWLEPVLRINDPVNTAVFDEVEKTSKRLNSKGASLCVVFPAVPKRWWAMNGDRADSVASRLKDLAANTPESSVYGDSSFFDTYYHLNRRGREIRTEQLGAIVSSGCRPVL